MRAELGYADYLGALQRYRIEHPRECAAGCLEKFVHVGVLRQVAGGRTGLQRVAEIHAVEAGTGQLERIDAPVQSLLGVDGDAHDVCIPLRGVFRCHGRNV